jgi:hypothetical protein
MDEETSVKDGGTKINDFEDLKIAFLALNKAYNTLARDYSEVRTKLKQRCII